MRPTQETVEKVFGTTSGRFSGKILTLKILNLNQPPGGDKTMKYGFSTVSKKGMKIVILFMVS
jgi:hypothetical protein